MLQECSLASANECIVLSPKQNQLVVYLGFISLLASHLSRCWLLATAFAAFAGCLLASFLLPLLLLPLLPVWFLFVLLHLIWTMPDSYLFLLQFIWTINGLVPNVHLLSRIPRLRPTGNCQMWPACLLFTQKWIQIRIVALSSRNEDSIFNRMAYAGVRLGLLCIYFKIMRLCRVLSMYLCILLKILLNDASFFCFSHAHSYAFRCHQWWRERVDPSL